MKNNVTDTDPASSFDKNAENGGIGAAADEKTLFRRILFSGVLFFLLTAASRALGIMNSSFANDVNVNTELANGGTTALIDMIGYLGSFLMIASYGIGIALCVALLRSNGTGASFIAAGVFSLVTVLDKAFCLFYDIWENNIPKGDGELVASALLSLSTAALALTLMFFSASVTGTVSEKAAGSKMSSSKKTFLSLLVPAVLILVLKLVPIVSFDIEFIRYLDGMGESATGAEIREMIFDLLLAVLEYGVGVFGVGYVTCLVSKRYFENGNEAK